MESCTDLALSYFKEGGGFSCSQAVLGAFAPRFGLDRETAFRVAGAFGGGVAATGSICGAVTGALMVIGLIYGITDLEERHLRLKAYQQSREFLERFRALHNSVRCRGLLGHDISTREGYNKIKEEGLGATRCTLLVRDAAHILEEMIEQWQNGAGEAAG